MTKEENTKHIESEPRKAKILVIEDEKEVLDVLSVILVNGGHEVETATNGNQGIEVFEKKDSKLMFCCGVFNIIFYNQVKGGR